MKTAWKIFLRDLRRLKGNYIAIMVLIGVCVIPSLYAWFNIYANMDPYANTANIKIAVVNKDAGTEDDKVGKLNAGAALESKLRKNDKLGWVFTREKSAIEGVKSGKYYAAIVIPESFSKDLASVFSKDIHQPEISYYTNMKKNAIAPKITDSGASTIVKGINEEFVASLTETVASTVREKAGEKESNLESANAKAKKAIRDASANTDRLNKLIKEFRAIKKDGDQVLKDGHEGLRQAKLIAKKTGDDVEDAQGKMSSVWNDVNNFSSDLRTDINAVSKKLSNLHGKTGEDLGKINSKIHEIDQELNQKLDPAVTKLKYILLLNQEILDGLTELNETYPNDEIKTILTDLQEDHQRHQHLLDLLESGANGAGDLYDFSTTAYSVINDKITDTYPTLQETITTFDDRMMKRGETALSEASQSAGHLLGLTESVQADIDDLSVLLD